MTNRGDFFYSTVIVWFVSVNREAIITMVRGQQTGTIVITTSGREIPKLLSLFKRYERNNWFHWYNEALQQRQPAAAASSSSSSSRTNRRGFEIDIHRPGSDVIVYWIWHICIFAMNLPTEPNICYKFITPNQTRKREKKTFLKSLTWNQVASDYSTLVSIFRSYTERLATLKLNLIENKFIFMRPIHIYFIAILLYKETCELVLLYSHLWATTAVFVVSLWILLL